MFGSSVLEVAIGLIFLYFILSLLVTAAREILEARLQSRAIHLERGIRELLNDEDGTGLASRLFNHPVIASLYTGTYQPDIQLETKRVGGKDPWKRLKFGTTLPAYIPARNFATALLDLSARGDAVSADLDTQAVSFERIRAGVAAHIPSGRVQRAVLIALDDAKGDLERARANLEAWYDSGMDRVSGWYRKQTQWVLFVMRLIAAVALNIDSTRIASTLYADEDRRALLVTQAEAAVDAAGQEGETSERMLRALGCEAVATSADRLSCTEQRLQELRLPIGWSGYVWPWDLTEGQLLPALGLFLMSLIGWLITALAVTLGAPFWFDILNKVMVIRSTVKPHEKSPEEDSEDRQQPRSRDVVVQPAPPSSTRQATGEADR